MEKSDTDRAKSTSDSKNKTELSVQPKLEMEWSGPLPPSIVLKQFDDVVPNGAERVSHMAEQEQQHRISMEQKGLIASINESRRGQYLGATISILALLSVGVTVYFGVHWSISIALVSIPVFGVIRAIVNRRSK